MIPDNSALVSSEQQFRDLSERMSTKTERVVPHDEKSKFFIFLPEIAYGTPRNVFFS